MYHVLADLHHWTPEQVNRMDPDFIEEHLTRERARQAVDAEKRRRKERQAARRAKHGGLGGEDADLSEIV